MDHSLIKVPIEFSELFDETRLKELGRIYRKSIMPSARKIMVIVNIKCGGCSTAMKDVEFNGGFMGAPYCKKCTALYSKYGITAKDYHHMRLKQRNVCAICKKAPKIGKKLVVDHCHTNGKVRGLLCAKCNSGIGFMEDNETSMWSAIIYLKTHKANSEYKHVSGDNYLCYPD